MYIPWLFKESSIDDFVDPNGETRLAQFMEDTRSTRPEDEFFQTQLVTLARDAIQDLPEREKMILYRRFGLFGNDEMTLEEIGKIIGLSRERVRQLEKEAKHKIRQKLAHLKDELKFSDV